ncbi:MAG: glycerol-3-phosphate dehydrogenase [Hyphomicrobiaceae bacterium]|nr:glycerol-3-phosphate dehydrogenase [Hyphomicrobiaceae bacterium]
MPDVFDLAVIGGGINGCGIARDAAGRGLSVLLCEAQDLGAGTSSRSTKLVHGGLRYLEQYDFRLVRESLKEREVLWRIAPHIIKPMRFVLPYLEGMRPAWMLRAGLFIYDHLGGRERLPGTTILDLATHEAGRPLKPGAFTTAFEYSDCWVDDARLVVLNAMDAAERGADIRTRTRVVDARPDGRVWRLALANPQGVAARQAIARVLVNAGGPWVAEVLARTLHREARTDVRLVQGSHVVVPRLFEHDRAYLLQSPDGRVVFAIPYEDAYTLIGTTDHDIGAEPREAEATAEEIAYLCRAASSFFAKEITPASVVWSFAGIRPLHDNGSGAAAKASRDYVLELDRDGDAPPLLTIIGGKITTYRRLAEHALETLEPVLPRRTGLAAGWTGSVPLPGGDFEVDALAGLAHEIGRTHPFLAEAEALRLAGHYGTRALRLLQRARARSDLGRDFGHGLSETEVRYLIEHEWARTADDVLWRRSKLGLRYTAEETAALAGFMAKVV